MGHQAQMRASCADSSVIVADIGARADVDDAGFGVVAGILPVEGSQTPKDRADWARNRTVGRDWASRVRTSGQTTASTETARPNTRLAGGCWGSSCASGPEGYF